MNVRSKLITQGYYLLLLLIHALSISTGMADGEKRPVWANWTTIDGLVFRRALLTHPLWMPQCTEGPPVLYH